MKLNGDDTFFIQFKTDESGIIGQYPHCISGEDSDKAVWKTFYSDEPEENAGFAKE